MACTPEAPTGFGSTLHPEQADTQDDLVALALTTQGSTEGFSYRWFIGETEIADLTGSWVSASRTARDQTWTVQVRHTSLPGVQEHQVRIANAPPEVPEVQILPEGADQASDLSCVWLGEIGDADGDELEVVQTWRVDGQDAGVEGEVLSAWTRAGQEWTCELRVSDGTDEATSSASVVLEDRTADWPEHVLDLADAVGLAGETNAGSGFNVGEWAGWRLAGVGDVDGDGLADALTVGRFNDTLADDGGKVYLVREPELVAAQMSLGELSTAWLGEADNDHLGRDVAGPGDLDGDGLGELLMSTYSLYEGNEEAGSVHLFLSSEVELGRIGSTSDAAFHVQGRAQREWVGRSLDGAGDLDGDGVPDLFVGIPGFDEYRGRAAVFSGVQALQGGTVFSEDAAWIFEGDEPGEDAGIAVTRAGDMDGDGLADLGIGGWLSSEGATDAGKTWVVLGDGLVTGVHALDDADHAFVGALADQSTGRALAEAGDVDGDGLDDLVTGGHGAPETGSATDGASWLILGSSLGPASTSLTEVPHSFVAEGEGDYAGDAMASADVDGDGRPDLLFGAHMNARGGPECGAVYLFLNDSVQEPGTYSLAEADRIWVGESSFDRAGVSLQSAGDMNGDGSDDVILGATTYDADRGKTYVLLSPFFE
jgi:hypothetical protein